MEKLSLEQLAVELDGNLWEKGELKRVYLDKGYNTKKMTTKTFVFQNEDGTFGVSVYIDCPSQDYRWIESQKNEIIKEVQDEINFLIQEEVLIVKVNENYLDCLGNEDKLEEAERFLNESDLLEFIKENDITDNYTIVTIPNLTEELV